MNTGLINDIKFNCDVSDAKYWGYFSICGLLMRYRDLYRSEQGLKPWADISREDITDWISKKEARWPEMEGLDFRNLTIGNKEFSPFALDGINEALRAQGLVYGAGYGMYMKPTFFLADLRSVREVSGLTVYTSRKEYVRDLFTAPGMVQGTSIFIRLEPLMALLQYKLFELSSRPTPPAGGDAFAAYGLARRQIIDDVYERNLETVTERYADVLLSHELAEAREDVAEWKDILAVAGDRNVEHFLRAVKDLIADTSVHGPLRRIIETRDRGGLCLFVALMDGFRRLLFPGLGQVYERTARHDGWAALENAREEGYERFRQLREDVIGLSRSGGGRDAFLGNLRSFVRAYLEKDGGPGPAAMKEKREQP